MGDFMKVPIQHAPLLYPTPVLLVGSYDENEQPNLMTVAWGGICCSDPPCISVSLRKATHSYGNLMARKAFTVCIPSEDQVGQADYCGIYSGRDHHKFEELKLTAVKSTKVNAPYAEEFPLVVECQVIHTLELGLHTMFIGQVQGTLIEDGMLQDDGKPDIQKLRPIMYAPFSREYFAAGRLLGKAFAVGRIHKGKP
jgi:flavin reductase (DIM6/NTAB) family NADH-FMN oxidoreductase RutF